MFKTYMRLLGFARPIKKYAIPYFFYSLLYALFNSLTFMLIIPILNTMFDANYSFEYVEKLPPVEFNQEYLTALFNSPTPTCSRSTIGRTSSCSWPSSPSASAS